jgi:hypothetical protein
MKESTVKVSRRFSDKVALLVEGQKEVCVTPLHALEVAKRLIDAAFDTAMDIKAEIEPRQPEKGAAGLTIELSDSEIIVLHADDGFELARGQAYQGDWTRLIEFLRNDLGLRAWVGES